MPAAPRPSAATTTTSAGRAQRLRGGSRGAERDTLNGWINYTNLRAIDQLSGLELARRPHVSANVGLTWTPQRGSSLGASLSYVGARFDDAANTVPLASATSVNVFASYALSAHLQVFGRVENLFDNASEPVFGYGAVTRGYFAGLRATL